MKKLLLIAALLFAAPAAAQQIAPIGPNPPCTAFGFTSTTCPQGSLAAPLASPALTGTPTAPTATGGTATTQIATTAFANGVNAPYWSISLITTAQTISSSAATLQFNNANFDTSSACNISSTFVCTPLVAGVYFITCSVLTQAGTGPVVSGAIATIQIAKNGTSVYDFTDRAQVAAIASPQGMALTSGLVQLNGSSDTVSCKALTEGTTTPLALAQGTRTYMIGYRTGAQ